jgi:transcriptional regulator with XRE-family HTH domain
MNLGKAIKLCRVQKNMKQSELSHLANISVSYLSLLERGKRDPNFSTIQDIASALKIPVSILMFLATDSSEFENINQELAEKLSYTALRLIEETSYESTSL